MPEEIKKITCQQIQCSSTDQVWLICYCTIHAPTENIIMAAVYCCVVPWKPMNEFNIPVGNE